MSKSAQRILALVKLGEYLEQSVSTALSVKDYETNEAFENILLKAEQANGWFDRKSLLTAFRHIIPWLKEDKLRSWLSSYDPAILQREPSLRVTVIMAGNIPLVNFHDFLCVWIQGFPFTGKLSSQDPFLVPFLHRKLEEFVPGAGNEVIFTEERIPQTDAVIATGSNNSSRYFEYYFAKYPHIIRKNRTSIAILDGSETTDDLVALGKDVFGFYGLGCRNVSKIFIPEGSDPTILLAAWDHVYRDVITHPKYSNNYDYHRAIYLVNKEPFYENLFLMLKESDLLHSPVCVLYYEFYDPQKGLPVWPEEEVQCVVGNKFPVKPGQAQEPSLYDYPDGIDVMEFLSTLGG